MTVRDHRLIMVVPATPGAGKSTIAHGIFQQLRQRGAQVQWLYEEDVFEVDALWRFAGEMERGDSASLVSFREGVRVLIDRWLETPTIHITDSFLPGFFWLRHIYSREVVQDFARELWDWVAPLDPLVVYCRADARVAFERAVAQRGVAWGEGILERLRRWPVREYPGAPIRSTDDAFAFFSWLDRESRELLHDWPGETVVVDTTVTPTTEALDRVLCHLGLESHLPTDLKAPTPLAEYVGTYVPSGPSSERERVEISLKEGSLFVTLYWPEGSVLVTEENDRFRIQATNRVVQFVRGDSGRVSGFDYEISWKGKESYVRSES